jgi:hypothetical protein
VPEPFHLIVALYNSSGERVRLLFDGSATRPPDGYTVSGSPDGPLQIDLPGTLSNGSQSLVWDHSNDAGQPVSSGAYTLKLESSDPFGTVTAYERVVQVLVVSQPAQLVLYNSAGEAVRHYDAAALGLDPVDLGRADGNRVEIKSRNGSLSWLPIDGLDDRGEPLQGGSYELVLHWSDAGGSHTNSLDLVLVPAPGADALASASLAQNPVPAGAPLELRYTPCACELRVRVHDLAGQLIASSVDPGSGRLSLALSSTAPGIYLVSLELHSPGQRPQRRVLKAALLR